MTSPGADDRRAKDLVRGRELPLRRAVGESTAAALCRRLEWRPAGCSARFFAGFGTEDPFLPAPPRRAALEDEEPRTVAAAARFARLDGGTRRRAPTVETMGSATAKESDDLLSRLRAEAARKREQGVDLTHTPSAFGRPAKNPIARGEQIRPKPPPTKAPKPRVSPPPPDPDAPEAERRRPPLIRDFAPDTGQPGPFGKRKRPPARPQRSRTPIRRDSAPPGGPPPVIRPEASGPGDAPEPTRERGAPSGPPGGAPPLIRDFRPETGPVDPFARTKREAGPRPRIRRDATPPGGAPPLIRPGTTAEERPARPKIGTPPGGAPPLVRPDNAEVPRRGRPKPGTPPGGAPPLVRDDAPAAGEGARPPAEPPAARPTKASPSTPPSGDPMGDFFAPAPKAPATPRTVAPAGGNSGGLDDLFGGMQEGRVRIGRVKRDKPAGDSE